MKRLLILALLLLSALPAKASIATIYYGQTSAGSNNGTSCANAYAYNDGTNGFNTAGKWGSGSTQIGQDTVVHLCGTWTFGANASVLFVQASGASGHPITILFDSGAIIQAQYCNVNNGCIKSANLTDIVIDGGGTGTASTETLAGQGIIRNTNNAYNSTFQVQSTLINMQQCHRCVIKNIELGPVYVNANGSTLLPGSSTQVSAFVGSGQVFTVTNVAIHDCAWCAYMNYFSTDHDWEISNSSWHNYGHAIAFFGGSATGGFTGAMKVHDNKIFDNFSWSSPGCPFHNDSFHTYSIPPGETVAEIDLYNNWFGGHLGGACSSGFIFAESGGQNAGVINWGVWNNVFDASNASDDNANGWIGIFSGSGATKFVQNTMLGHSASDQEVCYNIGSVTNLTFKGNVVNNCGIQTKLGTLSGTTAADYNTYGACSTSQCWYWNGGIITTLAAWRTATGQDAHAQSNASLLLGTNGLQQAGSPVIGFAVNLSSLATGNLATLQSSTTLAGNATPVVRPGGSTLWDGGAWETSGATAPALSFNPTPVAFGNQNTGTSSNITVTVTNGGTANQVMASSSAVTVSGAPYSVVAGGTCVNSLTLAPAGTCTAIVKCAPVSTGTFSGTLTIAGTVTATDALSCTGTNAISIPAVPTGLTASAAGNSVTLNWTASTGTPTGYNCLVSTTSGGPYTIFASPSGTTCTDSGLANGTYFFVVNAFNSAGTSANSSQVSATISLSAAVNFTPSIMPFGNVVVAATSGIQTITVKNVGTAALVLAGSNAVSISGAEAADFAVDGSTTCTNSLSVAINATCVMAGTATPSIAALEQATICLVSNSPSSPDCAVMSVTGTAPVSVSPTSLAFPSTYTNKTSAAKTVTFLNSTGSTITFSSVATSGGDSTQFVVGAACSGALVNGASCSTSVTLQPTSTGAKSSSLVFTFTGAGGSPISVTLTGTGKTHHVLKIGAVV